jgi:hypothetical protein
MAGRNRRCHPCANQEHHQTAEQWQKAVDWGDRDGGCYVTFDGPMAEQRARDYFRALKTGQLKVLRE